MDTFQKISILAALLTVGGILFVTGCQKERDVEVAQKELKSSPEPAIEGSGPFGKGQIPPGMEGQFPKEMLEAIRKIEPEPDAKPVRKGHAPVIVPKEVQGKWKAVVIAVVNKQTKEEKRYAVYINKEFAVPNSKIKIKVLTFLPSFSMSPQGITSLSNEPKNPAAQVVVYEDGKSIFEGWLFENHPQIHPFEHKVYGLLLKDQIPI